MVEQNNMTYPGSLHNHTHYSNIRLRDCVIKEEDLVKTAKELGHTVVAFTDHDFTGGWVKELRLQTKYPDIKIILGNEIYLVRNGLNNDNFVANVDKYYHFILLAKDAIGAKQIMEISTKAWLRSYVGSRMRRVITYYQDLIDIIGANSGHVIGATACLGGALATQILRGTDDEILHRWLNQMQSIFGAGNFFLELQPSASDEQTIVNKKLLQYSHNYNIPYIITTDSHYLRPSDKYIHEAYLKSQDGDREIGSFYDMTYMMSTEELESHLDLTDAELQQAYANITYIKNSCENYTLEKPLRIPDLKWKPHPHTLNVNEYIAKIPYLETFMKSEYIGDRELVHAVLEGIETHPDLQNDKAFQEINSNLEMTWISSNVNKAHWSAYYLNLQNIIDICWQAGSIVGPGRGSGVGFILLYVLGITQINPLRETTRCFSWRFLNPERVSVLDVDFDIEGGRRADVLAAFRKYYGNDRVANVATFRTEKSKSAILTAARGLGIDVDVAQYIASLIPADRGLLRTLDQCYSGDDENQPINQFIIEMNNYPKLWEVAQKVEGLICGSGIHAGGVIFVDEPFTNSTALMRAPDGTICTQFELHDSEAVSLIKYDALSVEAMDKIHNCLDLLVEQNYIKPQATLKDTYESVIGIYKIDRDIPEMWQMLWRHEINSLFQMEQQSGIQGIAVLKPTSVDDLAILNSTIRLMAQEKGGEMPTEKLARFKARPQCWDEEMESFGLSANAKKILEPILGMSYGLCIAQEQFMELVQLPELGGFSLTWADKLRKSIAKKNPAEYDKLTAEFFKTTQEKGIDQKFAHYVWDVLIAMSKGYGFNQSHTLAYSLIALQEMNLAYHYPIMFWNCACLISDAGGIDNDDEIDEEAIEESKKEEPYSNELEEFDAEVDEVDSEYTEEEDCDGYPASIKVLPSGKKKKEVKTTNYGKVAGAIGKMQSTGVKINPPDINSSSFTFSPSVEDNAVRFGLSGITRIGNDLIKEIILNRPYTSLQDFIERIKVTKPQMINLIKAGAFDSFGDRVDVMHQYINIISDTKKRVTMQNVNMLAELDLIPEEYSFAKKVFYFNKYLKKAKLGNYYALDNIAFAFYNHNFDLDKLTTDDTTESSFKILQSVWDAIYEQQIMPIRNWIKQNSTQILVSLNNALTQTTWDKYCTGNISKWEMESLSCYCHDHELKNANIELYSIDNFKDLPESPLIDRIANFRGKSIPIYKLQRIAGTVLDRNKAKKTVSLLTTSGVITVKIYGVFQDYDKQISERGADGKKHVIQKSEFSRGNKIIITGIKDGADTFRAKKYKNTPFHLVEQIKDVCDDGTLIITHREGQE